MTKIMKNKTILGTETYNVKERIILDFDDKLKWQQVKSILIKTGYREMIRHFNKKLKYNVKQISQIIKENSPK